MQIFRSDPASYSKLLKSVDRGLCHTPILVAAPWCALYDNLLMHQKIRVFELRGETERTDLNGIARVI